MREQKGQSAKPADTFTATMRRRQRDREPRVLLYPADGRPRRVPPEDGAHAEIVEIAGRLVELTNAGEPEEGER